MPPGQNLGRVWERVDLVKQAASTVAEKQVLYLEIGVVHGRSMRLWSSLLRHPDSLPHGFDSFDGLPPGGGMEWSVGAYSRDGKVPEIADSRVTFYKGLFEETLPRYTLPPHEVLVISIDCDLYTSTIFALNTLTPHLKPGTLIYFDEFSDFNHELRAFDEFLRTTGRRCSLIGATKSYSQTVFKFL